MKGALVDRASKTLTVVRPWLTLSVLALIGGYLYHERSLLADVRVFRPVHLLSMIGAELFLAVVRGLRIRELCKGFDLSLHVSESLVLASYATLMNLVAPFWGGTGSRALYLRARYGLPFSSFVGMGATGLAIQFVVATAAGGFALAQLDDSVPAEPRWVLGWVYLLVLAVSVLALVWARSARASDRNDTGRVGQMLRAMATTSRVSGWVLCLLAILNVGGLALSLRAALALMGVEMELAASVLLATAYPLSAVVALTPGGLGITESVVAFVSGLLGVVLPVALASAGLRRLGALFVTALVAAFGRLGSSERS